MPGFTVQDFGGIAPKQDPRLLADNIAQVARNCELERGSLHPLKQLGSSVATVGTSDTSIYYYNNTTWISYANDRDFAKVPIPNDILARVIITDPDGYPVVYSAGATYRVGIPSLGSAPGATATQTPADPNDADAETVSYVVTLVDAWGAEGPPSLASASIDRVRDTDVTLTLPAAPVGNYNFGAGALKRIYRSNSGSSGANYQFVKEVDISSGGTTDDIPNAQLGEVLPSQSWIGPPDDDTALYPNGPMVGVTPLPNGILAGYSAKTLVFNEPFLYSAWPAEYRITFDEEIAGIVGIAAGLLVTTKSTSYLVTGVHPRSMSVIRLDVNQACVSKRSVVDMGEYAIYASPDGLVAISGTRADIVTEGIFTRDQWQAAYSATTLHAYAYEGKYIAWDGTEGFIFDPRGGKDAFVTIDSNYGTAYYDAETDLLYVRDGTAVKPFAQSASVNAYQWKSKKFVAESPTNYGAIRIQAWDDLSLSNVTAKVYADGILTDTIVFNDSALPFARLSSGFKAKLWEIEVTGVNPISYVGIYHTLNEAV